MQKKSFSLILGLITIVSGLCMMMESAFALPPGSYQKSCKNCVDDGTTLRCDCSYKGKYSGTALVYGICEGDIWNDKSKLRCNPQGSFKLSCSSISWNENFLTANCKKKSSGTTWNSGFNYHNCLNQGQDIANCNGSLTCGPCDN